MNNFDDKYCTDYSFVEISTQVSPYAKEIGDWVFQFEANFYIPKKVLDDEGDCIDFENVLAIGVVGHTGDFENNYIYAADAISESTIENYAFIKGLYEELFHTEFHDKIIEETGQVINRWVTLESVGIGNEFGEASEDAQAELFSCFLVKFKKTWVKLFHEDINIISFTEGLYGSEEEKAQKKILSAYQTSGFYPTLNKQKLIENNSFTESDQTITLKELFKLDVNSNLFGENIKDSKRIHYSGIFYNH